MKSLLLEIPEDIIETARIPPDERETAIKRELAVHLYTRGILPKTAARRLSGLDRISFDDLLGQATACSGWKTAPKACSCYAAT
jgi:hypothetical protein